MATQTLAEQHQAGQEALVSLIPAVLREAWPLLDVHDIKGTLPNFVAAVRAIVQRYGSASAFASLNSYRAQRSAAGIVGSAPSLTIAPLPAEKVIEDAVGWATADLYGPVTADTVQAAQDRLSESVSQLVLDQGRTTVIDAVRKDTAAKGWVRVTEQGACSFCIMLALRGAQYHRDSFDESNVKFKDHAVIAELRRDGIDLGGKGDFKAHNNCRCHVEPIFTAYEPSARMREMDRLWKDSTKGRTGKDARVAFRQAVEGRPVTGSSGKKPSKPKSHNPAAPKGLESMSAEQLRHQIALTEGLKDSAWRTQQLTRLRKALRTAQ